MLKAYLLAAFLAPCPTGDEMRLALSEACGDGPVAAGGSRRAVVALCVLAEANQWARENGIPWDWPAAVAVVRAARARCEGCPPLERSYVLPPAAIADAGYATARDFRSKLSLYAQLTSGRESLELEAAAAECGRNVEIWDRVRWAAFGSIADRRVALRELEGLVGADAARVGGIPPPVPPHLLERWGHLP